MIPDNYKENFSHCNIKLSLYKVTLNGSAIITRINHRTLNLNHQSLLNINSTKWLIMICQNFIKLRGKYFMCSSCIYINKPYLIHHPRKKKKKHLFCIKVPFKYSIYILYDAHCLSTILPKLTYVLVLCLSSQKACVILFLF